MRAFIEIDGKALKQNYLDIKTRGQKDLIAVIKSNAYGHGLIECARILFHQKVPMFAVATIEEAIAIRKSLIFTPILLLGPCYDYKILSSYKITALIMGIPHLEKLAQTPYCIQIHLNIDTGMNRDGISINEIEEALRIIRNSKLQLRGICTHYSSPSAFNQEHAIYEESLKKIPYCHKLCCHSCASSTYGENKTDDTCFRVGLSLYGLDGIGKPVLSLKAPIVRKKKITKGDTVGYDEKGIAPEDGYVYTIGLGYADGWPRNYVTKGYINDHQLTQIGTTCMDYIMLFSKEDFLESEIITIIGVQHTVNEIAEELNTIPYEITTRLSTRLKRKVII